jgi:hypothetical protein
MVAEPTDQFTGSSSSSTKSSSSVETISGYSSPSESVSSSASNRRQLIIYILFLFEIIYPYFLHFFLPSGMGTAQRFSAALSSSLVSLSFCSAIIFSLCRSIPVFPITGACLSFLSDGRRRWSMRKPRCSFGCITSGGPISKRLSRSSLARFDFLSPPFSYLPLPFSLHHPSLI